MPTSPEPGRSLARIRITTLLVGSLVVGPLVAGGVAPSARAASPAVSVPGQKGHRTHGSDAVARALGNPHRLHRRALSRQEDQQVRGRILRIAASKEGAPYAYGASGPGAFDCSGFTRWVFSHVGIDLPHSSAAQVGDVRITGEPRPGDLVFFSDGGGVYHVAIYAGHHRIWHAPRAGDAVSLDDIWTSNVFYGDVRGV